MKTGKPSPWTSWSFVSPGALASRPRDNCWVGVARMFDEGLISSGISAAWLQPEEREFLAKIPTLAKECIRIAEETWSS